MLYHNIRSFGKTGMPLAGPLGAVTCGLCLWPVAGLLFCGPAGSGSQVCPVFCPGSWAHAILGALAHWCIGALGAGGASRGLYG
jgi:hypothetical protein